jgi:WD40 repeat protein
VGIVCEFTYAPESEHSDLRTMSFDVTPRDGGHDIAMVFSDSSIKVVLPPLDFAQALTRVKVYRFTPGAVVKWRPLARGIYSTSCLTQCLFLSPTRILTAGTDGHTVVWSLLEDQLQEPFPALRWCEPFRVHQSSSKAMASQNVNNVKLVVSGGDDGSLAVLVAKPTLSDTVSVTSPLLLSRAHASAVTACMVLPQRDRIFALTCGNDQWIRFWEILIHNVRSVSNDGANIKEDIVDLRRLGKMKTNVADVSSMAVLNVSEGLADAKVLICGVGMEVVRIEWNEHLW